MALPHSAEAEQFLVARLLLDPDQIGSVAAELQPSDFFIESYRDSYSAMLSLVQQGKPVDVVALGDAMGESFDILELTAGHHAPLTSYAEIIKRKSLQRLALRGASRIAEAVEGDEPDLPAIIERAYRPVMDAGRSRKQINAGQITTEYLDTLARRKESHYLGLRWGVPGMDGAVLPAGPGQVIIIAARPGVGKTALAESIVEHWASQGQGPVLFVSMEMDREELMDRAAARHANISARRIILSETTDEENERVSSALGELAKLPIEYLDDSRVTTDSLRSVTAQVKFQHEGRLAGIVVDYLQLLSDKGDAEVQRVTKISRNLKILAREMRCPLVVLSQLNRNVEFRNGPPKLFDLRESGSLEQDADVVVLIDGKEGSGVKRLIVAKQRQGPTGVFSARLHGDTVSWHEPGPWTDEVVTTPTVDEW